MDDLISRQAAIDAICSVCGMELDFHNCEWYQKDSKYKLCEEINSLRRLPPAQPEIIKCKDCKYWNNGSCEYPEHAVNSQDYWAGDIETEAEHFCGYAKRREVTT